MVHTAEFEGDLEDALNQIGAEMGPAECHGLVAGLICAKGRLTREEWLGQVAEDVSGGRTAGRETQDVLGELLEDTTRELSDTLMSFHLLLPGEDVRLEERTQALGLWCQGFLMGLTLGGVKELGDLPHDAAEAIHDLTEIAGAGQYGLEDEEEDESAYAELVEYVRTVVLLINEELNPSKAPPLTDSSMLH